MPTYNYECAHCGGFEARQPMADYDRAAPCPACGMLCARALSVPAVMGTNRSTAPATDSHAGDGKPNYRRLRHPTACPCCPAVS
ncbi:MAG: zinc ribbon domain-containing protein [Betaproteobacteria bacterium]|nr:zinc ribbon domain-containing protein [Betaproteobacteria bacterium]